MRSLPFFEFTLQNFLVTKPVKLAKPSPGIFIAKLLREPSGFGPYSVLYYHICINVFDR